MAGSPTFRLEPPRLRTVADSGEDRHSTWFELYFDLVFVAAISQLGAALAQDPSGVVFARFCGLFVVVGWAWYGFTLYADKPVMVVPGFDPIGFGIAMLAVGGVLAGNGHVIAGGLLDLLGVVSIWGGRGGGRGLGRALLDRRGRREWVSSAFASIPTEATQQLGRWMVIAHPLTACIAPAVPGTPQTNGSSTWPRTGSRRPGDGTGRARPRPRQRVGPLRPPPLLTPQLSVASFAHSSCTRSSRSLMVSSRSRCRRAASPFSLLYDSPRFGAFHG